MKYLRSTIIILICLIAIGTNASDNFSLNGYYKNFFVAYDVTDLKNQNLISKSMIGMISTRIRLDSKLKIGENVSVNLSYALAPRLQDKNLSVIQAGYSNSGVRRYRIDDFDPELFSSKNNNPQNFVIYHNLDRAYFSLSVNALDITLGRQAIAWGSARTINPTDVIAPYSFDELDSEERSGVDALRFRLPIGVMGEFDLGYLYGEKIGNNSRALYLRNKFYVAQTDLTFLFLITNPNLLLGFDMARSIGGAGFWIESAYVLPSSDVVTLPDDYGLFNFNRDDNYWRSTVGLDYSFGGQTYCFIDYHYNQAGKTEPADYFTYLISSAFSDGAIFLMGRHYLIPGVSYQMTSLITFTGQLMWNLSDNSILITPYLEYNIAENLYLAGGGYFGIGKGPDFISNQYRTDPVFKSEFGSYTNSLFFSFRTYF